MRKISLFVVFVLISLYAYSQNYPLNHSVQRRLNDYINTSESVIHTGFKPINPDWLHNTSVTDSIIWSRNRQRRGVSQKNWFLRKLRYENFVSVQKQNFTLAINPLLNLQYSKGMRSDSAFTINTRGIEIKGRVGERVKFYTNFRENQAYFPGYINSYAIAHTVVPGQGVSKSFGRNYEGHDFSQARGYFNIGVSSNINIELGHDKHFIGEGYRSLLLSDNTSNYPFIRLNTRWKNWSYNIMFAEFQNFTGKYYAYHHRKHAGFYYLSYKPVSWLEAGLFQSVIWNTGGENYTRDIPVNFFNPVIFFHSFQYGLDNANNVMAGVNFKAGITDNMQLYGQLLIDDMTINTLKPGHFQNKYGWQTGVKVFDILDSYSAMRLFLQAEMNQVAPYVYGHTNPQQSYTQLNQPLAHPLNAGFNEAIGIVDFTLKDFSFRVKYNYAVTSKDTAGSHFGSDIFKSDKIGYRGMDSYNNYIGQGLETRIRHLDFRLDYLINPRYNFRFSIGYRLRKSHNPEMQKSTELVYFGLRTAISNFYYDF